MVERMKGSSVNSLWLFLIPFVAVRAVLGDRQPLKHNSPIAISKHGNLAHQKSMAKTFKEQYIIVEGTTPKSIFLGS